ncbi:MAG: hypothetical protein RBS68_01325 [Anaerolineales bacterium]|nr:hypothetical protein [Anaerolineales bacterium]
MNPEKIWIVLVILGLILILSNALVFAIVRGWSRGEINFFKKSGPGGELFKQDKDVAELSERMRKLREEQKKEE